MLTLVFAGIDVVMNALPPIASREVVYIITAIGEYFGNFRAPIARAAKHIHGAIFWNFVKSLANITERDIKSVGKSRNNHLVGFTQIKQSDLRMIQFRKLFRRNALHFIFSHNHTSNFRYSIAETAAFAPSAAAVTILKVEPGG